MTARRATWATSSALVVAALVAVPVLTAGATTTVATAPVVHAAMPGQAAIYNVAPRGTARTLSSSRSDTTESTNWSGYAVTGSGATSAGGSWTVPSVVASSSPEYSASWVGVDGYDDSDLIQTGTGQDTESGSTYYYAWWEVLPAAETQITTMSVSPGDTMTAAIEQVSSGEWSISLGDVTTGQTWSTTVAYAGPGDSVEWIEEAPTVNDAQSSLADFGTVEFADATVDGSSAGLVSNEAIDMVNGSGQVIASPSAPSDGDSFSVTDDDASEPPPELDVDYAHARTEPHTRPRTADLEPPDDSGLLARLVHVSVYVCSGPARRPRDVRATPGNGDATVSWSHPSSDGGAPVTDYTVSVYAAAKRFEQLRVDGTALTVRGLTDGTAYSFAVAASNAAGSGPLSTRSTLVTPARPPSAPRTVKVTAGQHAAVVSWKAPAVSGGAPVTGYTLSVYRDGRRLRTVILAARELSHRLAGLSTRTAYTFRVAAHNRAGTGPTVSTSAKTP